MRSKVKNISANDLINVKLKKAKTDKENKLPSSRKVKSGVHLDINSALRAALAAKFSQATPKDEVKRQSLSSSFTPSDWN